MPRTVLLLAVWSALPLFAQTAFRYTPLESCGPNRSPIRSKQFASDAPQYCLMNYADYLQ